MNSDQEVSPTRSLTRTSSLDDLRQIAQQRPKEGAVLTSVPPSTHTAARQINPPTGRVEEQQSLASTIPFTPQAFTYQVPYPYAPPAAFGFGMAFLPGMLPGWTGVTSAPGFHVQKQKSLCQDTRSLHNLSHIDKTRGPFSMTSVAATSVSNSGRSSLAPQNGKSSFLSMPYGREDRRDAQQESENATIRSQENVQTSCFSEPQVAQMQSSCGPSGVDQALQQNTLLIKGETQHSDAFTNDNQILSGGALVQDMKNDVLSQNVVIYHTGGSQELGTTAAPASLKLTSGEVALSRGNVQSKLLGSASSTGVPQNLHVRQHIPVTGDIGPTMECSQPDDPRQVVQPCPSEHLPSTPTCGASHEAKIKGPCQMSSSNSLSPGSISGGTIQQMLESDGPGAQESNANVAGTQASGGNPLDFMFPMMHCQSSRDQFLGFYPGFQAWNQLGPLPGGYGRLDNSPGMMAGMVPVSSPMKQTPLTVPVCQVEDKAPSPGGKDVQKAKRTGRSSSRKRMQLEVDGHDDSDGAEDRRKYLCRPSEEDALDAPLAPRRRTRVPRGNPKEISALVSLCEKIKSNSKEFEADGRILRLEDYLQSDVGTAVIDTVLDALASNTLIEVLYIQNFVKLERLVEVLKMKRIWALCLGENIHVSSKSWQNFARELSKTAVEYLYVSEDHLWNASLKSAMKNGILQNKKSSPPRDPEVVRLVKNMWYNPKVLDCKTAASCATEGVSILLDGSVPSTGGLSLSLLEQPLAPPRKERALSSIDDADFPGTCPTGKRMEAQRGMKSRGAIPGPPAPLQRRSHVPKQENAHKSLGPQGTLSDACDSGQSVTRGKSTRNNLCSSSLSKAGGVGSQSKATGERRMKLRSSRKRLSWAEPDEDALDVKRSKRDPGGGSNNVKSLNVGLAKVECGGGSRTTFADMVNADLIQPGMHKWTVGHEPDVEVNVHPTVIRERNPGRRSCDGWKDVKWKGQRLEALRDQYFRR